MAAPKENLLYILLPGLKKTTPRSSQVVVAYADTEVVSPRPIMAPTFFASVLKVTDIESAAGQEAGTTRCSTDDFPAPPTADDWARLEPDLTWSECVRRAEARGTFATTMPRALGVVSSPTPASTSSNDVEEDSSDSVPSSDTLGDDASAITEFVLQDDTGGLDAAEERIPSPVPEVDAERFKSDKAMVEWMFDHLFAMVQMGLMSQSSVKRADSARDRRDSIFIMLDILQHTSFPPPAPILALWYIQELAIDTKLLGPFFYAICADGPCTNGEFVLRMFCAGMMLADKMLNDHTYNLKTWSILSDIPTSSLFKMEIASLTILGHNLTISPQAWDTHLERLMMQNARSIHAQRESSALPPSMVVGSLLRDLLASARASSDSDVPLFLGAPAPTSSVAYLELLWAGCVPVPNTVAVVQRGQITITSVGAPTSQSSVNRPQPAPKNSFHKRKASSSPEWSTAGDALATPITHKAPRTMRAAAIGAERERMLRAHTANTGDQCGTTPETLATQVSDWGVVQPWNVFGHVQPAGYPVKPVSLSDTHRAPVRQAYSGNRCF